MSAFERTAFSLDEELNFPAIQENSLIDLLIDQRIEIIL